MATPEHRRVSSRFVTVLAVAGAAFGVLEATTFQADLASRLAALTLAVLCLLVMWLNHSADRRREGAYKARHGL